MNTSYLIDTDILIYWLNDTHSQITKKIEGVDDTRLFISSITIAELYYGAYNSTKKSENIALVNELIEEMNVYNFEPKSADIFGEIKTN